MLYLNQQRQDQLARTHRIYRSNRNPALKGCLHFIRFRGVSWSGALSASICESTSLGSAGMSTAFPRCGVSDGHFCCQSQWIACRSGCTCTACLWCGCARGFEDSLSRQKLCRKNGTCTFWPFASSSWFRLLGFGHKDLTLQNRSQCHTHESLQRTCRLLRYFATWKQNLVLQDKVSRCSSFDAGWFRNQSCGYRQEWRLDWRSPEPKQQLLVQTAWGQVLKLKWNDWNSEEVHPTMSPSRMT